MEGTSQGTDQGEYERGSTDQELEGNKYNEKVKWTRRGNVVGST
jgi:hypothetical protein